MARKIVYIDENENSVDKSVFLKPYKERGIDTDNILQLIDRLDYAGGFQLSEEDYLRALQRFPREARLFLEDSTNINSGIAYLRGRGYYLHITFDNDIERTRQRLIENTQRLQELIPELFRTDSEFSLEEKIVASSIVDHKRHYSLAFLIGLYNHMLQDPNFNVSVYHKFREVCERDIGNYYGFLLTGKIGEQIRLSEDMLHPFLYIDLPENTKIESGARKLMLRLGDHPGLTFLYSGHLLDKDGEDKIDIVINPLAGAVGIGYALKTIYKVHGIDKIEKVHFIWYSPYDKAHTEQIDDTTIGEYVPEQLIPELRGLKKRRIFIIDDSIFYGRTLRRVSTYINKKYSADVNTGAIESGVRVAKRVGASRGFYFEPEELTIPAISEWRYIERVDNEIRNNNFGEKDAS